MATSDDRDPPRDNQRRSVLTQRERDALYGALDQGYYDVPRRVALSDLANELDTTDVELHERLRQGTKALLQQHRDE